MRTGRRSPSASTAPKQIKSAGQTLQTYEQRFLFVTGETFSVGRLIGVESNSSIDLTQSFAYRAGGAGEQTDLGKVIAGASADHVGSRRLPPRWAPAALGRRSTACPMAARPFSI